MSIFSFVLKSFLVFSVVTTLFTSMFVPAFAVDLSALLVPKKGSSDAFFKNVSVVFFEYPNGGKLKSLLENVEDEISFKADSKTPGMDKLIQSINENLVKEKNSPVTIEDLKLDFRATLEGGDNRAVLEHNIKLDATLGGFVLNPGASTAEGHLVDMNWRGLHVDEPIVLEPEGVGEIEINFYSGYLYAKHPEVIKLLENTDGMKVLNQPSIDFQEFTDLTLDRWNWLFDPTGSIKESERFGFKEIEGANLITFYAFGEGSLREGIHRERISEAQIEIDGVPVNVKSTHPPSSASVQIVGYADTLIDGENEGAIVYEYVPEGAGKSYTGGFPVVVLAVLGGLMGAVAGFVLWRANKKD